ncbi:LOW QUALITY PROTEIN: hypothetical protein HID58_062918, partial [Brassica napus]
VYCTSLRPILVSVRAMAVSHTALRREKQALTSLSDKDLPTLANGQRSSRVGVCLSHNLSYDVSVLLSVYGFKNDSFVSDKVTAPGGISFEDGIENIHIGGPAMIRAAAKVLARELREFRSPTDGETRMSQVLKGKSKTLRILEAKKGKLSLRQVGGGWLGQDSDDITPEDISFSSIRLLTESELADAKFAWLCVKHVKSNAIVIAKVRRFLANDKDSLVLLKVLILFVGSWKDEVEEACEKGIGAIEEPGGSIRDQDAIDCCNKYGVSSMLFNNVRHFRH